MLAEAVGSRSAGLRGRADRSLLTVTDVVVLVEHQMDLISAVCDRLTVLDFGRVICEGAPADVVEDGRVLEAYLGAQGGEFMTDIVRKDS